jgi:hypothetical protein
MALEDYIREARARIKVLRDQADAIEATLKGLHAQPTAPAGVPNEDGKLAHKPAAWRAADHIERLLERGKKTMGRTDLVKTLVEQKMVGGKDDDQREQYANEAIRRGIMFGYLKEGRSGTVHWVPGIRKSRVTKKL